MSAAGGNFLGDYALVENLETTKRTAAEIEEQVKEGKVTEIKINEAREHYRPAAARSSLLYFILNDLNKINPIYQFSLKVSCPMVTSYVGEEKQLQLSRSCICISLNSKEKIQRKGKKKKKIILGMNSELRTKNPTITDKK